jgi:hypothetical protein
MTTALELAQTAAVEMGLDPPSSVYASSELIPQQLGALLNLTGEMLVKRRTWRKLFRDTTITAVDGQATYELPSDFARPISQTEWDTINHWPLIGPETNQQWQWLKSGILSTGPRERFRLVGNTLEVWPVPGTNVDGSGLPLPITFSYYYVSNWWAIATNGQPKKKCTDDSDETIFDDRLMISGIKLRFYQAKQFDTTTFAAEFQSNLDDALAQDSGAPILSLSRQPAFPLITIYNIPDGNWPAHN